MKKLTAIILTSLMLFSGCTGAATTTKKAEIDGNGKIKVTASFNPIYQLVKVIGGDKVEVESLVTPGVEAHDFELTPKNMESLNKNKVLFINGLGMEPWAEGDKLKAGNKDLKIIDLSKGVNVFKEKETDPHIWLSIPNLKIMAANTKDALVELDMKNKDTYDKNLQTFLKNLDDLKKEYDPKFAPFKGRAFVTGHEAFGYFTREYGLKMMAVEGVFGEGEPTPQKIKELVDFVKANNIKTIFLEENASPKVSETIAKETSGRLVTIPTMESEGEILPTLKELYDLVLDSFK